VKYLIRLALSRRIAGDALRVALVVGALLNVINQGASLLGGQAIAWGSVALNFVVPYCVATYAAARNEARLRENVRD
jgi:hypothetical protein